MVLAQGGRCEIYPTGCGGIKALSHIRSSIIVFSSLGGSAFIVFPLPTGSTLRMVQWRTFFYLMLLWGVSFHRFPGLGSQGLRYSHLVVFLIAEPYIPSPTWATDAAQCVRLLPSVMVMKALKYSHIPGDFQHVFQSFLATEYGGSNFAA